MTAPILKVVRPSTEAQKATHTTLDTIIVTPELVKSWRLPPFQRQLRVNEKVKLLALQIKVDEVIPGVLTLGIISEDGRKVVYLLDGQHRREAFLQSGVELGYADVRQRHFESMEDMGEEFVNLNSQLVRMKPDDILRGLEGTNEALAKIKKTCPYVGYDMIRRSEKCPVVSMSALLRCWFGSSPEVPSLGGLTASTLAKTLTIEEADTLIGFLNVAMNAWGRDQNYLRLWLNLNLTICMWLYRRMVITPYSAKTSKLTKEQFGKCLMSLSADDTYLDWLVGRQLRDRDRSPAYARIRNIFAKRLENDLGKKVFMPGPAWSHGGGSSKK